MSSVRRVTKKISRNNTNFSLEIFEYLKQIKPSSQFSFLKYYQNIVREFINNVETESKGLLINHKMGMGKSVCAVAVASDLIDQGYEPIVILTKSLQTNMEGAVRKYAEMRNRADPDHPIVAEDLLNQFSFVSLNASNMIKQMGVASLGKRNQEYHKRLIKQNKKLGVETEVEPNLSKKILIFDEAHNFFRAITNGSKNAKGLYDLIMTTYDVRVIFLTGTLISSNVYELVPCFNMLHKGKKGEKPLFPEFYNDFYESFVEAETGFIKNKGKFQNRIMGLVSYVSHLSTPGAAAGMSEDAASKVNFPDMLPVKVERTVMDGHQYTNYVNARDKEKDEGKRRGPERPPSAMSKPKGASSTYRVMSRQYSNYVANGPIVDEKPWMSPKIKKIYDNVTSHKDQNGVIYSQFKGYGGLAAIMDYLNSNGWSMWNESLTISPDEIDEVPDEVAEVAIEGSHEKVEKRRMGGSDYHIERLQSLMSELKRGSYDGKSVKKGAAESRNGRTYAVISGDVDVNTRQHIQNIYNSPENANGRIIALLLITSTGAEGLDLKNVRHIHVTEPPWTYARMAQIFSRGVRNDAHLMLPPDQRNVQCYVYLSTSPNGEPTTDIELYESCIREQHTQETFVEAVRETAIECSLNNEMNCRVCQPTNRPLFTNDVYMDLQSEDPCKPYKETQTAATKIDVNGRSYYYKKYDKSVYGYKVYTFDDKLHIWKEVPENAPILQQVADAINESLGIKPETFEYDFIKP